MRRVISLLSAVLARLPWGAGLFPAARTTADRLASMPTRDLPLDRPVTLRWNDRAVPYVEADTDHDAAFVLGLIHMHLREAQLAIGKRLVYGRLSEMAGPFTRDVDHTLRTIDFPYSTAASEAAMPAATRAWLQSFVDGMNWYQDHAEAVPPEYGLLGLRRETWSVRDVLALGRIAGTDINWLIYFGLIGLRDRADWARIWQRALGAGAASVTSFEPDALLGEVLLGASRSGSNCVVVAPWRSASGSALLASDPHLSLALPNLWVLAGLRSPSFNVVGLMPTGVPVFGLGRSPHMAWGGTNMRAAASDLFDASDETIETRTERLRARWWRGRDVTIRRCALGPILSDAPSFRARPGETIALRWIGHEPSDEVTALLGAMRARTPEAFRASFATFAVGGQNMQFATSDGHIGQIMAVRLPKRVRRVPADLVLDPCHDAWQGHATATDLPWALDPPEGFLASANNPPTVATDTPVGYFYGPPERVERLKQVLDSGNPLSLQDLQRLQQDVVSPAARRLAGMLVAQLDQAGIAGTQSALVATLREWDGAYAAEAAGPVAFETLLYHVVRAVARAGQWPRADWGYVNAYLHADLIALAAPERAAMLRRALAQAAEDAAKFPSWGAMHRMSVQSILGRAPVIGARFRLGDYPTGGSRETPMKAAHGFVRGRHAASYGSQARFSADMSDPDATYATLFGGQDGWLGSVNYADQIAPWRSGENLRLPLTPSLVATDFPHVQILMPGTRQ